MLCRPLCSSIIRRAGDVMTETEQYCARAQECELRARQVNDREVRRQFLELARPWRQMAAQWLSFQRNANDRSLQLPTLRRQRRSQFGRKLWRHWLGFGTFAALPEEQI